MENMQFQGATIDDFSFQKNVKKDTGVRLEASVKFAVRYNTEQKQFAGDALITVQDAGHEGLFRLKFHHIGLFTCDEPPHNIEEKRRLHMEAASMLQPLWNQTITLFTAMVGIPPIKLPPYRVSEDHIHAENE